jgi:hypothetical protein
MWDQLVALIFQDNLEVECAPLLDWLRVASMASTAIGPNNRLAPPIFSINFNGPPADELLPSHRVRIQNLLLPGLSQLSSGIENALTTMANGHRPPDQ